MFSWRIREETKHNEAITLYDFQTKYQWILEKDRYTDEWYIHIDNFEAN